MSPFIYSTMLLHKCACLLKFLYEILFNVLISDIIYFFTTHADVDECVEDTDGCSQICTNTPGSFECSCDPGYVLAEDGFTCTGNIPRIHTDT